MWFIDCSCMRTINVHMHQVCQLVYMQEERLTNEGRHHLLLLHTQVHAIAESYVCVRTSKVLH